MSNQRTSDNRKRAYCDVVNLPVSWLAKTGNCFIGSVLLAHLTGVIHRTATPLGSMVWIAPPSGGRQDNESFTRAPPPTFVHCVVNV